MPSRQRPLSETFFADDRTELNRTLWNRLMQEVSARFARLEKIEIDWERVSQQGIDVALARINEVLLPAAEQIREIAELGFLIANSETERTLTVGQTVTFIINENQRGLFTPAPFLAVTRIDNADDRAIGRLMFFDRDTGVLDILIDGVWGNPGPHSDWQISATAGAVNAQIEILETVQGLKSDVEQLRTETATDRGLAQAARTGAETAAGLSATARTGSETARDKAQEWAEKPEDEPVETGPDRYSARHFAAKAEAAAAAIAQSEAAGISFNPEPAGLDPSINQLQKAVEAAFSNTQSAIEAVATSLSVQGLNTNWVSGSEITVGQGWALADEEDYLIRLDAGVTVDLATSGAGGLAVGESVPVEGTLHFHVIADTEGNNPVSVVATTVAEPDQVQDALVEGYNRSRRIASFPTDSAGNISEYFQYFNTFRLKKNSRDFHVDTGAEGSGEIALTVPADILIYAKISVVAGGSSSADRSARMSVKSKLVESDHLLEGRGFDLTIQAYQNNSRRNVSGNFGMVPTNDGEVAYSWEKTASNAMGVMVFCFGWIDYRERRT